MFKKRSKPMASKSKLSKSKSAKSPLSESRKHFQDLSDYWEKRVLLGDFLLDEWMQHAREATKDGLAVLDRLEECGYDTGKSAITSNVPTIPTRIELSVKASREDWEDEVYWPVDYTIELDGGGAMATGFHLKPDDVLTEDNATEELLLEKAWIKLREILAEDFSGDLDSVKRTTSTYFSREALSAHYSI